MSKRRRANDDLAISVTGCYYNFLMSTSQAYTHPRVLAKISLASLVSGVKEPD